jgi:hypothetical protein
VGAGRLGRMPPESGSRLSWRTSTALALVLTPACFHDFDALHEGVPKLVPPGTSAECVACLQKQCRDDAAGCLASEGCETTFPGCAPISPACAIPTHPSRLLSICAASHCSTACIGKEPQLDCLYRYDWPTPRADLAIDFRVTLDRNMSPDPGLTGEPLTVQMCWGLGHCWGAAPLTLDQPAMMSFGRGIEGRQPYLSVTGGGVQQVLFFETTVMSPDYEWLIRVISHARYKELLLASGLVEDASLGTLVVSQHECAARPMSGVSFAVTRSDGAARDGTSFYIIGGRPSATATASVKPEGLGGVANLRPGFYDIEASYDGTKIGQKRSVPIEADTITSVVLFPISANE